jgi:hypothetical protein
MPAKNGMAPAPGALELGPLGRCPRPLPRAPTLKTVLSSASTWLFGDAIGVVPNSTGNRGISKGEPVTTHTEIDIRAALFPQREQVPASTPIPPREVGTVFLSASRLRWIVRLGALAVSAKMSAEGGRAGTAHASTSSAQSA